MGLAGRRRVSLAGAAVLLCLLVPALAVAANPGFPGTDPTESPRANTPDDPDFDRCEGDDPDTTPPRCESYFDEEFRLFGFSPDSANQVPLLPHEVAATQYQDCTQLDAQGKEANRDAGDPECSQIAGVRADTAWKYSTGSPEVSVAILDTGIRWQDAELVNKVRLNKGELPKPQNGAAACAAYDCNGDNAFNVQDYAADTRVDKTAGDDEADGILDASDLIATFSDGTFGTVSGGVDDDGNRYVDDIAGWDFMENDNDPFDVSSCCSADGHGTGRSKEAVAETNNGTQAPGLCPRCQLMPLKVWDSFVVPIDNYAMAIVYAADNGASVAEGAVGGLGNSRFARAAFKYADSKGMALTMVSSDINSANHNYPTNYNEAIYIAGSLPDTAPNSTCTGPSGLPFVGDFLTPPDSFVEGCQEFLGILGERLDVHPSLQPITTSFFRNSNLTQYGGKADVVLMGSTGSENTGQASGAAGLLASYGREKFGAADPLTGNEIRQLLTMTAEDVLPENTGSIGLADKAADGWDTHFGYGRVNLAAAMERIKQDRVPPEAQIDSPDWFAPINVDKVGADGVEVTGRAGSPHGAGVGSWTLEYACGQDALDSAFQTFASGTGTAISGTLPKATLTALADTCDGSVENDPGRPAGTLSDPWPADPYPAPDPERHAFQIRLTVHEQGDAANIGRYRKTLHAYRDDGNIPGWPKAMGPGDEPSDLVTGGGGEVSPRLYDLDGDNKLDFLLPTTSGAMYALRADGSPVPSFNGGDPVMTDRYALEINHPVPAALPTPHEALRVPAIGDIDGDREADIVATAGEHAYAWHLDGARVAGFPVRVDPAFSDPCKPDAPNPCFEKGDRAIFTGDPPRGIGPLSHLKRGFMGSPVLADLDADGRLDVIAAALDQHVYAWDGEGDPVDGDHDNQPDFPIKPQTDGAIGAEIINTPSIAQLDGEGPPEIVIATNEVLDSNPALPTSIFELVNDLLESGTGANPIYAFHGDGEPVDGWPVTVGIAAGDLLPLVLPGHDQAVLDQDGNGDDEVSISSGTSLTPGGSRLVDGDGSTINSYEPGINNSPDNGPIINLADYASIGDILGAGKPSVVKGGGTVNLAANLLAVNQNLPFSHVEQAWDPSTGLAVPGFPRATDDFQLVSQAGIARVGGSGPGRQALVGTGLYQLHAYGAGGQEPAGWPKFTGGWIQTTSAVGDADGDGKLDVTGETREGWAFLWKTDVPACQDAAGTTNDEWWTFHHDERSSANYGTDGRPPGSPRELAATRGTGGVALSWKAPGDDWLCRGAKRYRVIGDDQPIKHPADGALIKESDTTKQSGDAENLTLTDAELAGAKHVAVLYEDDAGNWGHLRSIAVPAAGGTTDTDADDDGVLDDEDDCPNVAGPASNHGCPDVQPGDDDGDGVVNTEDDCPSQPGPESNGGCPLPPPSMSLHVSPQRAYLNKKYTFNFRVRSNRPTCIAGVTIALGSNRARTNGEGVAVIRRSFSSSGKKTARARKTGCPPANAVIRARRRP
jgi:hypothetical protein